jgi:hypothetical protein
VAALPAEPIDAPVSRHREQPGGHAGPLRVVAVRPLPDREEDLVDEIVRLSAIAAETEQKAPQPRREEGVELSQRSPIAPQGDRAHQGAGVRTFFGHGAPM